jgi:DNA-binding transcriptional MerR regulator
MVKGMSVLISEFAQATGLSVDTVRFYVRKGLLSPETGGKGGSNPYQIFTPALVETARVIKLGQSLGFSLKEIAAFGEEFRAGALTASRGAEILRGQLGKLEEKAAQLAGMIGYVRAKIAWLEGGGKGAEPSFGVFACGVTEGVAASEHAGRKARRGRGS